MPGGEGARNREPRVAELSEIQLAGDSARVMGSMAGTRSAATNGAPQPMAMSSQHASASKRRPAQNATCCDCIVDLLETFGADIANDLAARLPWYANDWLATHGSSCTGGGLVKVLSASLFSYISSILPAIVIGDLLYASTGGQLGLPEVLLSTGATGVIWAFIGGQPLCIIGVTMPVAIFTSVCYILSLEVGVPFLPWMGWICVLSGLMHIALAATGAVRFVNQTTAFSCEIFGFFISVTYIYDAVVALLSPIISNHHLDPWAPLGSSTQYVILRERSASFANLCIAIGTYTLCMALHRAPRWGLFTPQVRVLLADYAAPVSLIIFTSLSYLPYAEAAIGDSRLDVPQHVFDASGMLIPSFNRSWVNPLLPGSDDVQIAAAAAIAATLEVLDRYGVNATEGSHPFQVTSMGDGWANTSSDFLELLPWHIASAIPPAIMLTALFFFDHNVSSKLAQDSKFNLKKPTAYHWDFSVLGLEVLLCGLFGVPPGNGLIPQAPLHTRALATFKIVDLGNGQVKELIESVVETRWSNLLQSLGVLLSVFMLPALACIPHGCLDGTFLFLGMAGFAGNGLWDRLWLMVTQPDRRSTDLAYISASIPFGKVQLYTCIQLLFVVCVFILTKLPFVAVGFPLLIAVLIPFRHYVLPCIFTQLELDALDPPEEDPTNRAKRAASMQPLTEEPNTPHYLASPGSQAETPGDDAGAHGCDFAQTSLRSAPLSDARDSISEGLEHGANTEWRRSDPDM